MTLRTEKTLKLLADHFDLQIEYVHDLPDNVSGFLQPGDDPRFIFINANKSPSDQVFTIAHELAHFVMHTSPTPKDILPWYLKHSWQAKPAADVSKTTRRFLRRKFDNEWQADLWAFTLLLHIGATDDLLAILQLYPNKTRMFFYASFFSAWSGVKNRFKQMVWLGR